MEEPGWKDRIKAMDVVDRHSYLFQTYRRIQETIDLLKDGRPVHLVSTDVVAAYLKRSKLFKVKLVVGKQMYKITLNI